MASPRIAYDPSAGIEWMQSLTPTDAENADSGSNSQPPRIHNVSGMTPALAARAYARVLNGRALDSYAREQSSATTSINGPIVREVDSTPTPSNWPALKAIDEPIPAGPDQLPQPVVPGQPTPKTVVPPGLPDDLNVTTPTGNGGTQTTTVVPGTGGQSYDTVITDANGNVTSARTVANDEGGATIWTTLPDGTHSVTYVSAPDAEGKSTTENYSYSSAQVQAQLTAVTVGDGRGSWAKQTMAPDGSSTLSEIELQDDGITYYETALRPGGGTTTMATRPGSPEFQMSWLVGEERPDGSSWRVGTTGKTIERNADGSGRTYGELDGTSATFGKDMWGQPFTQTTDPMNNQIVTQVVKNAGKPDQWIEVIVSDRDHHGEAHYRLLPNGEQELIWRKAAGYRLPDYHLGSESYKFDGSRIVEDQYTIRQKSDGSRDVEIDGVVLGNITTLPNGLTRFTASQAFRDQASRYNGTTQTLQYVEWGPGRKPLTYTDIDGSGSQFKPVAKYTQFGEVPGFAEIGAGLGPWGQGDGSFGDRFGTSYLAIFDGTLPLIGAGGPGREGVGTAWKALSKNVGKTIELAAVVGILGHNGYRLADAGYIPGLNKGEARSIVVGAANSLGYQEFKEGNIAGGFGTLLGGLVGGAAIGKVFGIVGRPLFTASTAVVAKVVGGVEASVSRISPDLHPIEVDLKIPPVQKGPVTSKGSGAEQGLDPTPDTIHHGTVRMEDHPNFGAVRKNLEESGYLLVTEPPKAGAFPHVVRREVVDTQGNAIRVEQYVVGISGMRFLDLEHEVGHVRQLSPSRFPEGVPFTERVLQRANGNLAQSKNRNGVLTEAQDASLELHNRIIEYLDLEGRNVPDGLLNEHAAGVRDWYDVYRARTYKKGRPQANLQWTQSKLPDLQDLIASFEDLAGSIADRSLSGNFRRRGER